jgi:hypothetical protein
MVSDSFLAAAREAREIDELRLSVSVNQRGNDSNHNIEMLDVDEELGSTCVDPDSCARQENYVHVDDIQMTEDSTF